MQLIVRGWKLYFGDGSSFDSTQGSWEDAPSTNVQVLTVYYNELFELWYKGELTSCNYRDMYHTKDYFFKAGEVFGCEQAVSVPDGASVKLGQTIELSIFTDIYNKALGELTF